MYKVALIHPGAGVNWNRNSEIFALELARKLDNYFEVELLSGADCGSFSRPISSIPCCDVSKLAYYPLVSSILQKWVSRPEVAIENLSSFLPCIAYLLKHPVDLIVPQNGYGGLLVASCMRAIRGTPILFTEHNELVNEGREISRNLKLKPNRLIVLNPQVAEYILKLDPHQPLNIIPQGIDSREFTPQGKAIDTSLPKPIILCVAPLERNSNRRIELTIQAVSRLSEASLLICGQGADRDYFQDLGDRLLGVKRFQIRKFAYAQMPQVYRSADVFTLPSSSEAHGLSYIEAMASGLPVVTTDDAMRSYLIGNGGITCDVTDLDTYSESLKIALERHWHYQQLPRNNALRFSWQEIIPLYYKAVCQTISHSNSNYALSTST